MHGRIGSLVLLGGMLSVRWSLRTPAESGGHGRGQLELHLGSHVFEFTPSADPDSTSSHEITRAHPDRGRKRSVLKLRPGRSTTCKAERSERILERGRSPEQVAVWAGPSGEGACAQR